MTTGTTLCLLVVLLPSAVVLASPSDPVFGDAATLAPLDGAPADVLVADLDGDGDDDLLICGPGPVYWLEHGVSGWTGRDLVTTTTEDFGDCSSAAVADIDRDGRLDVAYSGPTDAYLLYGRDDGEWDAEALPALYQAATTLAFADLEPNGTLDLFVGRSDESRVRYRLNDGTRGTWSTPDDNVTGVIFGDMAIADIDGNGLVEVIVDDDDFLATYAETTIGWRSVTEPAPVVFDHFRLGDLDGDGDLDAVVGGLFGLGAMWTIDGALQAGGSQISDARGNTFALADIDQDGRVGVLHADRDGVLRLNRPALDGTWSERVFGTLSSEPSVLAALDADRDGDLDIIAADGSAIYQYENRTPAPASTWARADDLPGTYTSPEFATAADFDGDGDVDVLTTGVAGSGTVLLENLGAGDFAEPVEVNAVALVGNGTPADFDGDGDIDVAGVADDGIYWLNNDGAPPWSSERVSTATGALLASADLDADADVDLAVGVVATGLVSWLRNDDFATTFTELVIDDTRDALGAIAVGDLYDDGTLDIVVTQVDEGVAALVWYDGGGSWVRGMGPTLDAVATGLLIADADADGATEVAIHSAAQGSALYAPQLSDRAAPWTLELSRTIQTWAPRYAFFGDADRDGRPDWLGVSEGRQLLRFVTTTTLAGSPIDTLPGIAAFAVADLDDDGDVDFLFASTDEDAVGVRWNQRRTAPVSQFVFAAPLVSRARPDRTYVQTYVSFRNEGSADDAAIALTTVGLRATLGGEPLPPETLESWLDVTVWRDDLDFDFDPESDEPFPATYSGAADGVARFTLTDPPVLEGREVFDGFTAVTVRAPAFGGPRQHLELFWDDAQWSFALADDGGAVRQDRSFGSTSLRLGVGNRLPNVAGLSYEVDSGDSIVLGPLDVVFDPDNDPVAIEAVVALPAHGTLVDNEDGTFTYTNANDGGPRDGVVFEISDGIGTVLAAASIAVTIPPSAPYAFDGTASTVEDTPVTITLGGGDADDPATFALSAPPSHGEAVLLDAAAGTVRYAPDANYVGEDAFTFTVSGGDETSAPATVSLTVTATDADDDDRDGVIDTFDNCRDVPNADQADLDRDREGDACDDDTDGDGAPDDNDLCPRIPADTHTNHDDDEFGDACDDDDDNDGVADRVDLCPIHVDPDQDDTDDDGRGDACDDDRDGDFVANADDNCPDLPNRDQWDNDEDGIGDACDDDDDSDEVADDEDVCPFVADPGQADTDDDGIGDACDGDRDGDGVPTDRDCDDDDPSVFDEQQYFRDTDGDGFGVRSDRFTLCASVPPEGYADRARDNCPDIANPDQTDSNQDGIGNACNFATMDEGSPDMDQADMRTSDMDPLESPNPTSESLGCSVTGKAAPPWALLFALIVVLRPRRG